MNLKPNSCISLYFSGLTADTHLLPQKITRNPHIPMMAGNDWVNSYLRSCIQSQGVTGRPLLLGKYFFAGTFYSLFIANICIYELK